MSADNIRQAVSFTIPNQAELRGYALFVQGIMTSPTNKHTPQITNLSMLVVKKP